MDLTGVKDLYKDLGLFVLGVSLVGFGIIVDKCANTTIKLTGLLFGVDGRDIRNIFK
jgi:hypothetical protein